MRYLERALGELLAVHGEALRERSIVTLTRRPKLFTLTDGRASTQAWHRHSPNWAS